MPEVGSVHTNQILTNIAIGYEMQGFAAPRILPDLYVQKKSDLYYLFDTSRRAMAQFDDNRAPGTEASLVDFDTTTASYACAGHALAAAVPDEEIANSDPVFKPHIDKTEFLVSRVMLNMEIDCKTKLEAAISNGTNGVSLTDEWDDYQNSAPITDIHTGILTIQEAVGFTPNILVMDYKVWLKVSNHPDIVERVLYGGTNTNPAQVAERAFAAFFGFDELIIAKSLKNTSAEGQSTPTISRIWGEDVYMAYRPMNPGIKTPSLGYRFTWRPFSGGYLGWSVKQWREERKGSDMIQVEKYYDQKICMTGAIYRIANTLS